MVQSQILVKVAALNAHPDIIVPLGCRPCALSGPFALLGLPLPLDVLLGLMGLQQGLVHPLNALHVLLENILETLGAVHHLYAFHVLLGHMGPTQGWVLTPSALPVLLESILETQGLVYHLHALPVGLENTLQV